MLEHASEPFLLKAASYSVLRVRHTLMTPVCLSCGMESFLSPSLLPFLSPFPSLPNLPSFREVLTEGDFRSMA